MLLSLSCLSAMGLSLSCLSALGFVFLPFTGASYELATSRLDAWCASGHPLRLMTVTRGRFGWGWGVGGRGGVGERGEGAMSNAAFVRSALLLASHDSGGGWGRSVERIKANVLSQRTNKDIAGEGRGVEGMVGGGGGQRQRTLLFTVHSSCITRQRSGVG